MPYRMGESKKKDAVWRQKEARIILFKFNAVAERRQWSSAASIPPQPSGQPSKIPQLQLFPLRAAIQIVSLIVDKGRGFAFPTGL